MFDEIERLGAGTGLRRLLEHYAAAVEPEVWQDRVMRRADTTAKDLVQLHGELIANDWIEQNTGVVTAGPPGTVACCYRVTATGRRALRQVVSGAATDATQQAA